MAEAAPNGMDWDLSSYFPSFDGPEMRRFKETLRADLVLLRERATTLPPLDAETIGRWAEILTEHEEISTRLSHLNSYISCLAAADTRVEAYLLEQAATALINAESAKLRVELIKAFKEASDDAFSSLLDNLSMKGAAHHLRRLREESKPPTSRLMVFRPGDGSMILYRENSNLI
jgi:oligoendopeptidase F